MKYAITFIAFVVSSLAGAQEGVTVVATGERKVEPAYRIATTPSIIDTVIPTPAIEYPLLSLKFPTTTEIENINPASVNTTDKLAQLYNGYVKVGIGTELMPLGELYWDANRSRKYVYGAHIKHLSSFGNIPGYAPAQFDRTRSEIYGGINENRYTLNGSVHYANQGLHYFGISDTLNLLADSIKQRFHDTGGKFSYSSHKKDSANLNYSLGLNYNNFMSMKPIRENQDEWRARENMVGFSSNFWYRMGKEVYATELSIRYNGFKYGIEDSSLTLLDTGIVLNNTVISLKPSITTLLKNNRFKAKIGADLTVDIHNETRVYIYPMAELKYSMFNDIFIPYAGLRGGLRQTTFKTLINENEFLLSNVNMLNENNSIDAYGGIKGTLSKRISFNAAISFANVKNKALFVTDTMHSLGNKFNVIFDTMNVTRIEGSVSYQLKEKLKIDGIARFNSYSLLNNSYAWNLPQLEFILRGSYNLYDKFLFNLDLKIEQGRRALVYEPGENITLENGQFIKELNFIADANLSVEYRYNKRISAFLQFNNIASQRYMRWYNLPVQSFQVMGGITFRF